MSLTTQDKEDIKNIVIEVVDPRFDKLERKLGAKIDSHHTINVNHHLETRTMVGDLHQDQTQLREGMRSSSANPR